MPVSNEQIKEEIHTVEESMKEKHVEIQECNRKIEKTESRKRQVYKALIEQKGELRALKNLLGEENSDDKELQDNH